MRAKTAPLRGKRMKMNILDMTITLLSRGFRTGADNEILCADCGVNARVIGVASGAKRGHSALSS
jgi:hypothetical protein